MNYEAVPTPETIPAFLPHSAGTEAEKHGCLAHGRAILAKNVKHDGKD